MPLPSQIRRIVLTGFMGAGKSTVGDLLAEKLAWTFVDVDKEIEARAGMTVAAIFAERGEQAFRALEATVIRNLSEREELVLALGGGALETESTRTLWNELGCTCVVFLDAPLEVLVERCLAQPGPVERPVLADRDRLLRRFESRLPHYRAAHVTLATQALSPAEVADRILDSIAKRFANEAAAESVPLR